MHFIFPLFQPCKKVTNAAKIYCPFPNQIYRPKASNLAVCRRERARPNRPRESERSPLSCKINLLVDTFYKDQAFIPGERGVYPEFLETRKTTRTGLPVFFRPVKISDDSLLQSFLYSLSDNSIYRRFISSRKDMPHERVQRFVIIDYTKEISLLAILRLNNRDEIVGVGQYALNERTHTAEIAFIVSDRHQNQGIGTEMLSYLTFLAKRQGLLGFTAEVLWENRTMLHVFEKMGCDMEKRRDEKLQAEGEVFRSSPVTTMMEQSYVVKKFFISLVSHARNIFFKAHRDAESWNKAVMSPLVKQIKEHKEQMEKRLENLRKINESRDTLQSRIEELEKSAVVLKKQVEEVRAILNLINRPIAPAAAAA